MTQAHENKHTQLITHVRTHASKYANRIYHSRSLMYIHTYTRADIMQVQSLTDHVQKALSPNTNTQTSKGTPTTPTHTNVHIVYTQQQQHTHKYPHPNQNQFSYLSIPHFCHLYFTSPSLPSDLLIITFFSAQVLPLLCLPIHFHLFPSTYSTLILQIPNFLPTLPD